MSKASIVEISESGLIDLLCQSGRERDRGFTILMDRFQERLYWHIRRMVHLHEDADDVMQNVFIKVFKNISKFNKESSLFTWLYRIATNESISYLRRKKDLASLDDEEYVQQLVADSYFDGDQAQLLLKKAIMSLPDRQRAVFNMRYYESLSYAEIAEICQVAEGGLKASYHLASKKIEAFVKKYEDEK